MRNVVKHENGEKEKKKTENGEKEKKKTDCEVKSYKITKYFRVEPGKISINLI